MIYFREKNYNHKSDFFFLSLYKALLLEELFLVYKWPRPSRPLKQQKLNSLMRSELFLCNRKLTTFLGHDLFQ